MNFSTQRLFHRKLQHVDDSEYKSLFVLFRAHIEHSAICRQSEGAQEGEDRKRNAK